MYKLGDLEIHRAIESEVPIFDTFTFFPDATRDVVEANKDWLMPRYIDPKTIEIILCIQSYIIKTSHHTILVDTCVGNHKSRPARPSWHMQNAPFIEELANVGVHPEEVDFVLCTHLHVDHVGWNTKLVNGRWVPTFPKAKYVVQKSAWDEAFNQDERLLPAYGHPVDHLNILEERDMVEFLDGNTEVSPGVFCEMIDGYSEGHQIVKVNAGSERIVYLSELIPAPSHLPLAYITAYDRYPDQTLEMKRRIIAECEQEGWLMVFAHGYKEYAGYIKRMNQTLALEPIAI